MLGIGAGSRILRWGLWILLGWVFVRGLVSLLPSSSSPSSAGAPPVTAQAKVEPDGLRAFPAMFARQFLTWQPANPEDRALRLRSYLASGLDRQGGWTGKQGVGQIVEEIWPYAVKSINESRWLVTIAARVTPYEETSEADGAGGRRTTRKSLDESTMFLAIPVSRTTDGWVVYDYPTLLPPPTKGQFAEPLFFGQEVTDKDGSVRSLLSGFFTAYLGAGDVTYYLTPNTRMAPMQRSWTLDSVSKVVLINSGTEYWALADVVATNPSSGARFTFRYTLEVVERESRWYIKQISQRGE